MVARIFTTILCILALAAFSPSSINPKDYGVKFDGVSDDTAAWQATINAAQSQGLPIAAPCGSSAIYHALIISDTLSITGGGEDCTTLKPMGSGQSAIEITTVKAASLRGFSIVCPDGGNQTGIVVAPATGYNQKTVIADVGLIDCEVGIYFVAAAFWKVDFVYINSPHGIVGILVSNGFNADFGDGQITNSTIAGTGANSIGIAQYSSGGLRISNSKIIGWTWGYLMQLAPGAVTSDLLITGNSFELNQNGIGFWRQAGSGAFHSVVITGNEISAPVCIENYGGSGWLSNVGVTGNRLECPTGVALGGVPDVVAVGNF